MAARHRRQHRAARGRPLDANSPSSQCHARSGPPGCGAYTLPEKMILVLPALDSPEGAVAKESSCRPDLLGTSPAGLGPPGAGGATTKRGPVGTLLSGGPPRGPLPGGLPPENMIVVLPALDSPAGGHPKNPPAGPTCSGRCPAGARASAQPGGARRQKGAQPVAPSSAGPPRGPLPGGLPPEKTSCSSAELGRPRRGPRKEPSCRPDLLGTSPAGARAAAQPGGANDRRGAQAGAPSSAGPKARFRGVSPRRKRL